MNPNDRTRTENRSEQKPTDPDASAARDFLESAAAAVPDNFHGIAESVEGHSIRGATDNRLLIQDCEKMGAWVRGHGVDLEVCR